MALFFSGLVWFFLWHTRWGYAIRAVGKSNDAAIYGGINPKKIIVITMCISGALAGLVGINELMGVQHRLFLNFNFGYGFGGIGSGTRLNLFAINEFDWQQSVQDI